MSANDQRLMTNVGSDRAQLAHMAKETQATLEATDLDVIADRGYFSSEKILACDKAGITVTLPKPMTSNAKAEERFGKQDLRLSRRREARLSLHHRGEWIGTTPILDQRLSELHHQKSLHHRQRATDHGRVRLLFHLYARARRAPPAPRSG